MIHIKRHAFTLTEMMIGLAIFLMISLFYFRTVLFSSKMEQATSKKLVAVQALQVLQARIRRDVKWARTVKSENNGHRLVLEDFSGKRKVYDYDPGSKLLQVPKIAGNGTEPYRACKFRVVKFYFTEHRSEGVRTIISPLPSDEKESASRPEDQDKVQIWGAAMVGRAEVNHRSVAHRYGLFNEPAFGSPLPDDQVLE